MDRKKLNSWDISRSDNRDRCGHCFKAFTKKEHRFDCEKYKGYRFSKVCIGCSTRIANQLLANEQI